MLAHLLHLHLCHPDLVVIDVEEAVTLPQSDLCEYQVPLAHYTLVAP